MEALMASIIECGVAFRARRGEAGCGDVHVVAARPDGVLVAAVDGLGHGKEAEVAATAATSCLQAHAYDRLEALFARCHETLRSTRGAVMSAATFDRARDSMAWLAVGNVVGVLLRRQADGWREHTLLQRSGVLGSGVLPAAGVEVLRVAGGDTLVFATDGIERDFDRELVVSRAPQRAAETILARYAKSDDDALVLVVRYVGKEPKRAQRPARVRRMKSG
jgi:phosphoserine phosphatase RsbX